MPWKKLLANVTGSIDLEDHCTVEEQPGGNY